jgi:hypothetical protein
MDKIFLPADFGKSSVITLYASVIISSGYRDTAYDYLALTPKVRLPVNEFSSKID